MPLLKLFELDFERVSLDFLLDLDPAGEPEVLEMGGLKVPLEMGGLKVPLRALDFELVR